MSYKVGDWLKNKHTSQLYEVIDVSTSQDGIHCYHIARIDSKHFGARKIFHINFSMLEEHFTFLPMARLLYSKNV
jgi:hypothetical protein